MSICFFDFVTFLGIFHHIPGFWTTWPCILMYLLCICCIHAHSISLAVDSICIYTKIDITSFHLLSNEPSFWQLIHLFWTYLPQFSCLQPPVRVYFIYLVVIKFGSWLGLVLLSFPTYVSPACASFLSNFGHYVLHEPFLGLFVPWFRFLVHGSLFWCLIIYEIVSLWFPSWSSIALSIFGTLY